MKEIAMKFNRKRILTLCMISALGITESAHGDKRKSSSHCDQAKKSTIARPRISQKNSWFLDDCGRVMIFHGLNIMNKKAPWYLEEFYCPNGKGGILGEDWAQFWVENGFNMARVGIMWAGVEPSPGIYDDNYILKIRDMVRMFAKYGIFCTIDWHQDQWTEAFGGNSLPAWTANNYNGSVLVPNVCDPNPDVPNCLFAHGYFANPGLQQIYDNFWNNVPSKIVNFPVGDTVGVKTRFLNMVAHTIPFFKDEPFILAYETLNELNPTKQYLTCANIQPSDYFFYPMPAAPSNSIIRGACTRPTPPFPPSGCQTFDLTIYAQFKKDFTATIRSIDQDRIIFEGLPVMEIGATLPIISPPTDLNVAILNNAYFIDSLFGAPYFYVNYLTDLVQAFAAKYGIGYFVKEMGAGLQGSLPTTMRILDQKKISWAYWNFLQGRSAVTFDSTALREATENMEQTNDTKDNE